MCDAIDLPSTRIVDYDADEESDTPKTRDNRSALSLVSTAGLAKVISVIETLLSLEDEESKKCLELVFVRLFEFVKKLHPNLSNLRLGSSILRSIKGKKLA